jgi:DNA-binding MarR family transcriptional regulator
MSNPDNTPLNALVNDAALNCASFQVRKISRLITRSYDTALAGTGLKSTQFTMLAAIIRSDEGHSLSEVAEQLGMDRTTFSRNMAPLIKLGFVEHMDTLKGRSRNVCATEAGRQTFAAAAPAWQKAQLSLRRQLEQSDQAGFLEALASTANNIKL